MLMVPSMRHIKSIDDTPFALLPKDMEGITSTKKLLQILFCWPCQEPAATRPSNPVPAMGR